MKVSVIIKAYNLERYIAQALESALMQQTNFDYEIIVGEDGSTDGTREIVREYARRYPKKIRLILPDENLGAYGNIIWAQAMEMVRGSYVALLDGDDYWTAPDKLQKQSDFLDTHPECAICFHNVRVVEENRTSWQINNLRQKKISSLRDIVAINFIGSCSMMYRHGLFEPLPTWFVQLPNSDWALHILNAQHGDIGYLDEEMSVYRIHPQGFWSEAPRAKRLESVVEMFRLLRYRHLTPQLADAAISQYLYALAYESWRQKRWGVALRCLRRAFRTCPFNTLLPQTLWRQWQRRRGVR